MAGLFAVWKLEGKPDRVRREQPYECVIHVPDGSRHAEARLSVVQSWTAVGTCVWDGCVVGVHWVAARAPALVAGKTVVEFGAGTGLFGIAAAAMGAAHVHVTDLALCLPTIRENVRRNRLEERCTVAELDLSRAPASNKDFARLRGKVDTIVVGEVMYLEELSTRIAEWCDWLLARDGSCVFSWGRNAGCARSLFAVLEQHGFEARQVPIEEHHETFRASDCHICQVRRRDGSAKFV